MTLDQKNKIIQILRNSKGDDLFRAKMEFKDYTPDQMSSLYYSSGKTPNQILLEYELKEKELNELINAVNSININ